MNKNCVICGTEFNSVNSGYKACSAPCREISRINYKKDWWQRNADRLKKEPVEKQCKVCDKLFKASTNALTCSSECRIIRKQHQVDEWIQKNSEKIKARNEKYWLENKEKQKILVKKWRENNKDREKIHNERTREKNREKILERRRSWRAQNPFENDCLLIKSELKCKGHTPAAEVVEAKAFIRGLNREIKKQL